VRVFDVEIAVRDDAGVLRPGMTANAQIRGPARRDVVRVPIEAVFLSEGRTVVFKLVNGIPERVPVALGLGDLSWVELVSGVALGDSITLEDPEIAAARAANPARRR
jgi:multidrug efflux pump subunit AcrA (membrane-fusion protein)